LVSQVVVHYTREVKLPGGILLYDLQDAGEISLAGKHTFWRRREEKKLMNLCRTGRGAETVVNSVLPYGLDQSFFFYLYF
jgi:hypothetical protein